jgi:hypothetical protein
MAQRNSSARREVQDVKYKNSYIGEKLLQHRNRLMNAFETQPSLVASRETAAAGKKPRIGLQRLSTPPTQL